MPSRFVPRQSSDPGILLNNFAVSFQLGVRSVIESCGEWKNWIEAAVKDGDWGEYRHSFDFMDKVPETAVFFLCVALMCLMIRHATLTVLTRRSIGRYKKYL